MDNFNRFFQTLLYLWIVFRIHVKSLLNTFDTILLNLCKQFSCSVIVVYARDCNNREAGKLEEKGVPLYSEKPLPENPRGTEMVFNTPDIPPSVLHAYEAYRQKIQKGLNLYAQYFLALHD